MPYKEAMIVQKYWTISEVAILFNVATSLLRYWETEFENIHPKRHGVTNKREYTSNDIYQINQIYYLLKERGFTMRGAKKELK